MFNDSLMVGCQRNAIRDNPNLSKSKINEFCTCLKQQFDKSVTVKDFENELKGLTTEAAAKIKMKNYIRKVNSELKDSCLSIFKN